MLGPVYSNAEFISATRSIRAREVLTWTGTIWISGSELNRTPGGRSLRVLCSPSQPAPSMNRPNISTPFSTLLAVWKQKTPMYPSKELKKKICTLVTGAVLISIAFDRLPREGGGAKSSLRVSKWCYKRFL